MTRPNKLPDRLPYCERTEHTTTWACRDIKAVMKVRGRIASRSMDKALPMPLLRHLGTVAASIVSSMQR
jgi:hypothetical protein